MSLIAGITGAISAIGSARRLFGGGSDVNIARSLSSELGCRILQSEASQARALRDKGINVCSTTAFGGTQTPEQILAGQRVARPGGAPLQAGVGGPGAIVPIARGVVGGIARAVGGGGLVRTATGRISGIILPSGVRFSRKRAASMIRKFGMEAAAAALGIGLVEAAEILLTDSDAASRRRRGRGITAAQLRNAKRVNCQVKRMAADLGCGVRATTTRRRKTSCR